MAFDGITSEIQAERMFERYMHTAWRIRNVYTCVDKDSNILPFRPNFAQEMFLQGLRDYDPEVSGATQREIILKSRQLGFSTLIGIMILDDAMWHANRQSYIVAKDTKLAKKLLKSKVRDVYERLPQALKDACPIVEDNKEQIRFANGSVISCGTSARGLTVTGILHISELGEIAAESFADAEEVRTGSLPAVSKTGWIFAESTAKGGQDGLFYEMVQRAERDVLMEEAGKPRSEGSFNLTFVPWFTNPENAHQRPVALTAETQDYFEGLEQELKMSFTAGQKSWYQETKSEQGGKMGQEQPSTPAEAFDAALDTAIFKDEMQALVDNKRIGIVPYRPEYGDVQVWFDLGHADNTAMWFVQDANGTYHVLAYYESNGSIIDRYINELKALKEEFKWNFLILLPHDAGNNTINGLSVAEQMRNSRLGEVIVVPRTDSVLNDIEIMRPFFTRCKFDGENCAKGIQRLKTYQWNVNSRFGTKKRQPLHDHPSSHTTDAFRTGVMAEYYGLSLDIPEGDVGFRFHNHSRTGIQGYQG